MAEVVLTIGGRQHRVACREGSEARLTVLAQQLDARWADAQRAAGAFNYEQAMLLVALMLADALDEAENRPPLPGPGETALMAVADRLEALATTLEQGGATP